MKNSPIRNHIFGVCAVAILVFGAAASAQAQFLPGGGVNQNNPNLPPEGVYLTPSDVHAMYSGGALNVVLSAVQHQPFANGNPGTAGGPTRTPVNGGMDVQEDFQSSIMGEVSINGGPNFPVSGTGPVTVVSHGNGPLGSPTGTFNTEMLQMNLTLGGGVMIRESPTLASLGQTKIQTIGGGNFHIDSFFDVFTELSLDGGGTWIPSTGSAHVNLVVPEPSSVMLGGLAVAGLGVSALRRRKAKAASA